MPQRPATKLHSLDPVSPKGACCLNCHFLIKWDRLPNGDECRFVVDHDCRLHLSRGDDPDAVLGGNYSLACHKNIWDEANRSKDSENDRVQVLTRDRGRECFFYPYTPGMFLPTADELEKRVPHGSNGCECRKMEDQRVLRVNYWFHEDRGWEPKIESEADSTEGLRVTINLGSSTQQTSPQEILHRISARLQEAPIHWLTPSDGLWKLDLDRLGKDLGSENQLNWLSGTKRCRPEAMCPSVTRLATFFHPCIQFYLHSSQQDSAEMRRVFVVHGHDDAAREQVARLLGQQGLEAVILHEQVNKGRSIMEKFEANADVCFAVVLLTADDVGRSAKATSEKMRPRARQNVILELGFFLARLGRENVCVLCEDGVEKPSDYDGIVYIKLDQGGAWRTSLVKELRGVGLPVDMNKL